MEKHNFKKESPSPKPATNPQIPKRICYSHYGHPTDPEAEYSCNFDCNRHFNRLGFMNRYGGCCCTRPLHIYHKAL